MPNALSPGPVTEAVSQALAPAVAPQLVANIDTVAASYNLPDFIFGGGGLMAILFFHGLCIALIYPWYTRRSDDLLNQRAYWRVEMLFLFSMFLLMMTHLGEIVIWAFIVHQLGLVDTLH